jgi:long-chain fatty acid transport protein
MKKVLTCVGGLVLSCVIASTAFAGAVDNKTNWSAEYIRTLARNAATDYADIAAYNPAGTVKLEEGFIINGSIQFLTKDYENIINGTSFESDEPSYVPGVFGVFNNGKWSLFAAFSNYGGGGKVDFSQGNLTTNLIAAGIMQQSQGFYDTIVSQSLNAESYYLGYSLGGAFSFNEVFSISLAARYIDAFRTVNGSVVLNSSGSPAIPGVNPLTAIAEYDQDASGWGGIIGLNIAPNDALNIGIRYEIETDLDFKATVYEGEDILALRGIVDGEKTTRNLPALLGLGFSYNFTDKLRAEADLTYYFNENADWNGAEENVENGYDLGIALEYMFNDKLLGSIGYLYTKLGMDPENMLPENPELDANTIGGGIAYAFTEKFHGNLSLGHTFYKEESFTSPIGNVEYKKSITFLALGLEYRFM